MRVPQMANSDPTAGFRDAESLFRSKLISEIRNVESSTKKEIEEKKEELRQLVGNRYRDLIDSADSIVLMKSSCESISSNISMIDQGVRLLSASSTTETPKLTPNPARVRVYAIATRVKYLVDTPENIWGCLDESMFLEASGRYIRAKVVHGLIVSSNADKEFLSKFPLLHHQWQIVESFKGQISQRSRERLMDQGLGIGAYADALAAAAVIDDLDPKQVLGLFLDSRKSWISHKLGTCRSVDCNTGDVISVFCDVVRIIQVTLGQVGESFLQATSDMPLFYKNILGSPPGSQLFGGLPNPEEEVRLWKLHREKLESVMVMLEKDYISQICSNWLKNCGEEIVSKVNGRFLVDIIKSGEELSLAERLIRESLDSREVLEGSLDWLKSVFGSESESPWSRIRELVLNKNEDLWDGIFEDAFLERMKEIVKLGFEELNRVVDVRDSVRAIGMGSSELNGLQAYLSRPSMGGGVWFVESNIRKTGTGTGFKATSDERDFHSCLTAYFGPEVSQIKDAVDSKCQYILEDLLCFLESQKAASRLRDLAPYLQEKCYESVSNILGELEKELGHLSSSSDKAVTTVERSLFVGRLLFALRNHSSHIPLILGSPRLWVNSSTKVVLDSMPSMSGNLRTSLDSPLHGTSGRQSFDRRQSFSSPRRQSSASVALFGVNDSPSPKLELISKLSRDLCIEAHSLWISWVSDELSAILSKDLNVDDALSATTRLKGWEETVIKQEQSNEDSLEMKIALPSMPSLYIISFLFKACEEVHRAGGHVLDKLILQKFASRLLEMVIGIYSEFVSTIETRRPQVTEKGVLQILLDLRFTTDILSGGDVDASEELPKNSKSKLGFKQNQDTNQLNSASRKDVVALSSNLSQRLDPIDWATYEAYLWDNEKQAYLRYAVLFGFFVQLNRMHTNTAKKLPSSSEYNTMRCSTVPRFKYLPISVPALSSKGAAKSALSSSSDDISSRSSWKAYSNGELSQNLDFDETSSFGVAAPFLKSFMQVGSRFGESTLKLSSMLTDSQVGRLKDKSAAAMSTFGDMLPVQAAGLLSSFTVGRSDL